MINAIELTEVDLEDFFLVHIHDPKDMYAFQEQGILIFKEKHALFYRYLVFYDNNLFWVDDPDNVLGDNNEQVRN